MNLKEPIGNQIIQARKENKRAIKELAARTAHLEVAVLFLATGVSLNETI